MDFIERIRKISLPREKGTLSELEKRGDPEALAASFSDFKTEKEMEPIGAPRASSLYDACMRKHVIGTKLELMEPRWYSLKTKLIYGIGNAVHREIQNTRILFGDRRYGWWYCKACQSTRYFGAPPKRSCEKCGAHEGATIYLEHSMRVRKPVIVNGHPDMFFRPPHSRKKVRVAEIKTMGGEEFDKLAGVTAAHEWQISIYQHFCSLDQSIPIEVDPNVGYMVYVTKRTTKDRFPLKIYTILHSPDLLRRIKAKLTTYKHGLIDYPDNLPEPIDECLKSRFEGYRAKQCVALEECVKNWKGSE